MLPSRFPGEDTALKHGTVVVPRAHYEATHAGALLAAPLTKSGCTAQTGMMADVLRIWKQTGDT